MAGAYALLILFSKIALKYSALLQFHNGYVAFGCTARDVPALTGRPLHYERGRVAHTSHQPGNVLEMSFACEDLAVANPRSSIQHKMR